MKQERVLYIEATFVKPRILRRFGNCVSSWAPNFQLWKALLTSSKRRFSSSEKGSAARLRKRGQETPCTSISSWKTTCQWVKWTRIRHIWIEFPLKYSWGPSFKGRSGGGLKKILEKSAASERMKILLNCRPARLQILLTWINAGSSWPLLSLDETGSETSVTAKDFPPLIWTAFHGTEDRKVC